MHKRIKAENAPAALGPYSQAVEVSGKRVVYCSGQLGLDPATGALVGTTAAEQARQVMENLKAVLGAAGLGFDSVVKTTLYLTDLSDFGAVNEVYGEYFAEVPPARATIEAQNLPKGALVEIDAVAVA